MRQYFEYTYKENGQTKTGRLVEESEAEAIARLKQKGVIPLTIKAVGEGTARELLSKGLLRTLPVNEIIRLLAMEIGDTMYQVQLLALPVQDVAKFVDSPGDSPARPVRKSAMPVRQAVAVEVCPYHDHESESNCHGVGELTQMNPNDCMDSLFKYYL